MNKPTAEQQAIIAAYKDNLNLVVEAGAGTGKTSTCEMLAQAKTERTIYVCYNKPIAVEAQKRFPRHVKCSTAHSLAFRSVGSKFAHRLRGVRMPYRKVAKILDCEPCTLRSVLGMPVVLSDKNVARAVMNTVAKFCRTSEPSIEAWMTPIPDGIEPEHHQEFREYILPRARKAWEDLTDVDGQLPFSHDNYLKMWAQSNPRLDADVVFLDEAQDADPLIASVVEAQTHAQRVMVGDRNQSIYAWRGAVDAMSSFKAERRLQLSQSFRFGPAIADEANLWLEALGATLRLRGFDKVSSTVTSLSRPQAILCRTNAGALSAVMHALEDGTRVGLVGGGDQVRVLAEAARDLQLGKGCDHPELVAFQSWSELEEYSSTEAGSDLKVFVGLINSVGADKVIDTVRKLCSEERAELTVSTAHKSKGREWGSVKIHNDFRRPKKDESIRRDEAMLAYVAVTRAKRTLDNEGLSWVSQYVNGAA